MKTPALLLVILLFPHAVTAKSLDLDSFIRIILDNNPGVQRILAADAIAEGELEASLGIDDPLLRSGGTISRTEFDKINGFEPNQSDNTKLDLSLDRTLSRTGTRLSASYSNQYVDRSPPLASSLGARYYQPSITMRLTQPLMKNVGGIQDRLNITLKRLNHDFAQLNSREQLESYITRLAALYLDWHQAYTEKEILREAYRKVQEQEELVELKVEREVAEAHELLRIQETREDYYSRWQQSLGAYRGLTRRIEKQMNQPVEQKASDTTMRPGNPSGSIILKTKKRRNEAYLSTDSRLKNILDNLQAQQEELVLARDNSRRPDLDVSLAYTRHGTDPDFQESHADGLDKDDYSLMLEYRYPLGNRQALGDYQAQIATRRQVRADTAQQLIDAEAALADLSAREKQLARALAAADRKIGLAARKLQEELRLYRIGKLDLFELLQDATTQLESRLNRAQLYVQLQQIRLSMGELLDSNLTPFMTDSPLDPVRR